MYLFLTLVVAIAVVAGLALMSIPLRLLLDLLASGDILFTFCAEGEIKYIMRGETLERIIMRVEGKRIGDDFKIINGAPADWWSWWNPMRYLERKYGLFFIGIPPLRLHVYRFEWDKLVNQEGDKYEIEHRNEPVDSLFFRYTYPVVARGIDVARNLRIDVYGNIVVEADEVYTPVMILKGEWFTRLRAPVEGAMNDYPRKLGIKKFREADKKGGHSELAKSVLAMNEGPGGVVATTGMRIVSFDYVKYDITPNQPEIEAALLAKQIKESEAEGVIAESVGKATAIENISRAEATAIKNIGEATAGALKTKLAAASTHHRGADVLRNQQTAEAIAEHKGTLVLGGGAHVMVGADSDAEAPEPASPPRRPQNPRT